MTVPGVISSGASSGQCQGAVGDGGSRYGAAMADHVERPLLFLDVDGTLLPYGGAQLPSTLAGWDDWQDNSNPQLVKLVPGHGPRLLALSCDLIWATAWMEDANEVIAPLLGLPPLPVVDLPSAPEVETPRRTALEDPMSGRGGRRSA